MLIDVAIPEDRDVIQKEAENILKYKDLTIQIIQEQLDTTCKQNASQ
jgi:hypothetical protein